jgi:hypothetical protein
LGRKSPFARLLLVRAARDDVHDQPAIAELIECRQLTRRKCGRDEARPMREQELEPRGLGSGVRSDLEAVWRGAVVPDQDAIEVAVLVCLGERRQVALVDVGAGSNVRLGRVLRRDETEDLEVVVVRKAGLFGHDVWFW